MTLCLTCGGNGFLRNINDEPDFTCPVCKGTGDVPDEVIEDEDDGQPTEQDEWRDYDPDC